MNYEPTGGFPTIKRIIDTDVESKALEDRGFSTNIVSIGEIMDSKKRENLFFAFGTDEDDQ